MENFKAFSIFRYPFSIALHILTLKIKNRTFQSGFLMVSSSIRLFRASRFSGLRRCSAQNLQSLFQLQIFGCRSRRRGRWFNLRRRRRRGLQLRLVLILLFLLVNQIRNVNRFGRFRSFYFYRRLHAGTCAVVVEKSFAVRRSPFCNRKKQTVAAAQSEQLLFRSSAEAALADDFAAFVVKNRRGDDFRRARRSQINQRRNIAAEQIFVRISRKGLRNFVVAPDNFRQIAVFDKLIGNVNAFIDVARRHAAQI